MLSKFENIRSNLFIDARSPAILNPVHISQIPDHQHGTIAAHDTAIEISNLPVTYTGEICEILPTADH